MPHSDCDRSQGNLKDFKQSNWSSLVKLGRLKLKRFKLDIFVTCSVPITDAPRYHKILLPMGFGRLPLQSNCDLTSGSIFMSNDSNERGGMELDTA